MSFEFTLNHDDTSPVNIGSIIPAGARLERITTFATEAWDDSINTRLDIGISGDITQIATSVPITAIGAIRNYTPNQFYATDTQLIATLNSGSSTQGEARITVRYKL